MCTALMMARMCGYTKRDRAWNHLKVLSLSDLSGGDVLVRTQVYGVSAADSTDLSQCQGSARSVCSRPSCSSERPLDGLPAGCRRTANFLRPIAIDLTICSRSLVAVTLEEQVVRSRNIFETCVCRMRSGLVSRCRPTCLSSRS